MPLRALFGFLRLFDLGFLKFENLVLFGLGFGKESFGFEAGRLPFFRLVILYLFLVIYSWESLALKVVLQPYDEYYSKIL